MMQFSSAGTPTAPRAITTEAGASAPRAAMVRLATPSHRGTPSSRRTALRGCTHAIDRASQLRPEPVDPSQVDHGELFRTLRLRLVARAGRTGSPPRVDIRI